MTLLRNFYLGVWRLWSKKLPFPLFIFESNFWFFSLVSRITFIEVSNNKIIKIVEDDTLQLKEFLIKFDFFKKIVG